MVFRWLVALVVVGFLGIQFVPVERTNPPVTAAFAGPPEVKAVLERSCYDCHSNETRWPWYSRVAPVSWMVSRHVREGREHLNFSQWDPRKEGGEAAKEIWEEVDKGRMPLRSYLLAHPSARLSQADRDVLRKWAAQAAPAEKDEAGARQRQETDEYERHHKEHEERGK
ncbi:MAG: hypothetical protein KatS3mg024_0645 [Armatimonadota bacterium]|nr:MAG: hypothetical protein KatS3mg024_0645 [Armatimonadota bacterium]